MAKTNSKLEKLVGKPCCGDTPIGEGTEAAARPTKASSIENGKFTSGCDMYGTEGVGSTSGKGGKRQATGVRGYAAGQTAQPGDIGGPTPPASTGHSNVATGGAS